MMKMTTTGTPRKKNRFAFWSAPTFAGVLVLTGCGGGGDDTAGETEYPTETIEIMVGSDPGGGWDMTARAVARTLTEGGVIETGADVYNVPGGTGTVGLTQLINDHSGNPHQLMVTGKSLVTAVQQTESQVDLTDSTTIAGLSAEYNAIAVPAESEYETFEQVMDDVESGETLAWGGGAAGSIDQILVAQLAKAIGLTPDEINYIPYSGGGELTTGLLSGDVDVAVSGLAEFRDQIDSGEMRLLAVSSEEPIEGVDAPTIIEAGYDVSIANWRGIVAAPDISDNQRDQVIETIDEIRTTDEWQEILETNNWEDFSLTGDEFSDFIQEERETISQTLADLGVIE